MSDPRGARLARIEVLGLDIRLPPREAAAPLRALVARFASGALR
ncbi:hypothetical protein RM844_10380 [Streptomyces sp. DSM 44915]|uniref:Uncharacterized protein n=1 Tax=Streptomyces chisholmiae TaxID=3075540 RepID=A0ABU2JNZ1_9ACTN|nr:hypothetical protein [Streptomyces sp. DSM 44915]MDT0266699.1 hypothetical protein [Streptomyces sp. DSM 44915]